MISRITAAICESMAGVGGKRRLLSGGTGFLAISGIIFVFLVFNIWREYNRIFHCCSWFCLELMGGFFLVIRMIYELGG